MAPALLLVPAALASFILAFGTGVEFVRFTSLRPLLGGIPESGGPGEREGPRMSSGLVMRYWEPVPRGPVLWEARAEPWATWVPLLCFVLHVISWLLIFSILLVFDYAELMGLKQVYYHVLGLGEPLALKSPRALRLFSHLRHPVCIELLTVLWVVPTLGTDRLLLALLLTLYLGLAHGLDQQDLRYLRAQLQRKLHLLSRPQDGEAE
ncbi:Nurim [Camelus dromedarius]|uniref:Nurim n=1 Tax=Camelus dromedarius TaxID=9838 RepID=A0A5N4CSP0_CAMDR|nr:Nurim [Camelus dromedarius]